MIISDEARLLNELAHRYRKIWKVTRPVVNSSMPVDVRLSILLRHLINVDENEQFITLKLFLHLVHCYIWYTASINRTLITRYAN